jgi:hypothetical protein
MITHEALLQAKYLQPIYLSSYKHFNKEKTVAEKILERLQMLKNGIS